MNNVLKIYTDGACRGNPGIGGWGAILKYESSIKEINGFEKETTNNIMELKAVIEALKLIKNQSKIIVTTDSTYVKNGINEWIHNWKLRGWKTANKKPVKNKELWQELDVLSSEHQIDWKWVRGHTGHPGNEKADLLANQAIDELLNS